MSYLKQVISTIKGTAVLTPILAQFLDAEATAQNKDSLLRKKLAQRDSILTIRAMRHRYAEFIHGEKPAEGYFHPSALGQCLRKLWFEHYKAPRDRGQRDDALRSYLTFEFGTYLHIIIQNLCHRAGILHKREFRLINDEHKIIGTCDGILKISGALYLLEIKSINSNQWVKVQQAPKHEHKQQMLAYMRALDLRFGTIIYVNKDRSTIKEHVLEFDPVYYEPHVRQRISGYRKHVAKKTVPAREGNSPRTFPCSFCPFTSICFTEERLIAFTKDLK